MKERCYRNVLCFAHFSKICVLKRREPEEHTFALFVNMEKIHLSETNSFFYLAQFTKLFFFLFFFLESHTKSVHLYLLRLLPSVSRVLRTHLKYAGCLTVNVKVNKKRR